MDESRRGVGTSHIPFRQSKLTLTLRDSFVESSNSSHSKMIMIGCVSPGSTFTDYSLNTLWYASKIGGGKRHIQSKYANAAFGSVNQSLNSSILKRGQSGLNGSFDYLEKNSAMPSEKKGRKVSFESENTQELGVKYTPKDILSERQEETITPTVKEIPHKPTLTKAHSMNQAKLKEKQLKNNFIRHQFENEEEQGDAEKDQIKNQKDTDTIFKLAETLRWESDTVRQECKLLFQNSDFNSALNKHRPTILKNISAKIAMLQKLETLLK